MAFPGGLEPAPGGLAFGCAVRHLCDAPGRPFRMAAGLPPGPPRLLAFVFYRSLSHPPTRLVDRRRQREDGEVRWGGGTWHRALNSASACRRCPGLARVVQARAPPRPRADDPGPETVLAPSAAWRLSGGRTLAGQLHPGSSRSTRARRDVHGGAVDEARPGVVGEVGDLAYGIQGTCHGGGVLWRQAACCPRPATRPEAAGAPCSPRANLGGWTLLVELGDPPFRSTPPRASTVCPVGLLL